MFFFFYIPSMFVCYREVKKDEMMCLILDVWRCQQRPQSVRPLSPLCSLVGNQNEITSSCNITNLTQQQLIVLPSSFLLLSGRLLPSPLLHAHGIQQSFSGYSVILVWLLVSPPHTPSPTVCFLPMSFVLLMGYRAVINSQHSVSESTHQRRAGLKRSQLCILLIRQPKEKYPHGP